MLKILVFADDGYPTIHPLDCPFAIESRDYEHEYDCGIPRAKQYGRPCECESEGECPYLELYKKPLDK